MNVQPSARRVGASTVTPRPLTRPLPNPNPAVRLPLFLAALLTALAAAAQTATLTLTGRVLDADSGEPVAFAHVGLAERGIGTATGFDGRFEVKLPVGAGNDEFSVSSIGYDTYRVRLRDFADGTVVRLAPAVTGLTEVVVMDGPAAENIIRKAVRAIPDNYGDAASNSRVFYRESLTDDSLRFRYLAEGVLDVYKTSYANPREGQVGVVQGRKINLRDPLDTVVRSGFTSGHMAAHRFDVVKNREDFLDEDFFPVYRYRLERMTTYDGAPVYVIAFDADPEADPETLGKRKRKTLGSLLTGGLLDGVLFSDNRNENTGKIEPRLTGRVFVEKGSHAILRTEFEVTDEGLRRYSDYPLYSGRWDANAYTVNYRRAGDRWYFSDAVREGTHRGGERYTNEVRTTALVDGTANRIDYLRRVGRNDQFVDLTGRYSPDFWRDYNVLPMSEGLAEGMRQFETMRLAEEVFGAAYQDSLREARAELRRRDSLRVVAEREAALAAAGASPTAAAPAGGTGAAGAGSVDDFATDDDWLDDRGMRVRWSLGLGAHLLPTSTPPLAIAYGSPETPSLTLEGAAGAQDLEAVLRWDIDFVFRRHLFARYSSAFDLGDNVYKDRALGIGAEANLRPRARPLVVRGVAQYEWLRYYRTIGRAPIAGDRVEIDGKRFKGDEVRVGYGGQFHQLALSGEVALETRRNRALFARVTYHHPLFDRPGAWFKETRQVFRKDRAVPLRDAELSVRSGEAAYDASLLPEGTWTVSVGWVFQ